MRAGLQSGSTSARDAGGSSRTGEAAAIASCHEATIRRAVRDGSPSRPSDSVPPATYAFRESMSSSGGCSPSTPRTQQTTPKATTEQPDQVAAAASGAGQREELLEQQRLNEAMREQQAGSSSDLG